MYKQKTKIGQNKILKGVRGITLIALVVTIIVLLILAGVSIATLTGQENILEKAAQAKDKTELESLKEEVNLMFLGRTLDESKGEKVSLKEDLEKKISGNKKIEEIEGITDAYYVSRNGKTVTVYEDGTVVEGRSIWDGVSRKKPEIDSQRNWHIYTPEELYFFEEFVNGKLSEEEKEGLTIEETTIVYLENDLDMGARQTEGNKTRGEIWDPIGKDDGNRFIGTFEGNNHTVRGIYTNKTEDYTGLFGRANIIKNTTIKNSYILGGKGTGAIVGRIKEIDNCKNEGVTVRGGYNTGGVVGYESDGGIVKNCNNTGTVIGEVEGNSVNVGGVIGFCRNAENCNNIGDVMGKGNNVGGVVGILYTNMTLKNCSNMGKVIGEGNGVGGVIGGTNSGCTISNSKNIGEVIGKGERVGGIIGDPSDSVLVKNSINMGKVIGESNFVGGIVGIMFGTVEECYNIGEVQQKGGKMSLGGIIGGIGSDYTAVIKKCYNKGKIIEEASKVYCIGGIVGSVSSSANATITNNYNIGQIEIKGKNVTKVGAISGDSQRTNLTINNNYYLEGIYHTEENKEGEVKTETFMKTQDFVDLLNNGLEEAVWEINGSKNNGYPVIKGME